MATVAYQSTLPVQGDPYNVLLAKLAQVLGTEPSPGDTEYDLLWKVLEAANGS